MKRKETEELDLLDSIKDDDFNQFERDEEGSEKVEMQLKDLNGSSEEIS